MTEHTDDDVSEHDEDIERVARDVAPMVYVLIRKDADGSMLCLGAFDTRERAGAVILDDLPNHRDAAYRLDPVRLQWDAAFLQGIIDHLTRELKIASVAILSELDNLGDPQ